MPNGHKIMQIFLLILSLQVISVELCDLIDISPEYCKYDDNGACYERKGKVQKCNDTASLCGQGRFCVPSEIKHVNATYRITGNSKMEMLTNEYEVMGCVCSLKKNPFHIWNDSNVNVQNSPDTKLYKMMMMSTFSLTAVCVVFIIIIICLCVYYQTCKKCRRNRNKHDNANGKPSSSQQNGENNSIIENQEKTDV